MSSFADLVQNIATTSKPEKTHLEESIVDIQEQQLNENVEVLELIESLIKKSENSNGIYKILAEATIEYYSQK